MSSVKFMAYVSRIDPVIEETKCKINDTIKNFNQIKKESLEGQSLREFLETTETKNLLMLEKGSQLKSKNIRRIHSSLLKSSIQQHRILVDREKEYIPVVNKLLREYRRKIFSGNFSLLQKPKQKQNLNKMKSELENLLKNHEIIDNSEYTVYNTYFGNADIDKESRQVSLENVLNKVTDKLFNMTKNVLTENGVEVNEEILQSKIISMQEEDESDKEPSEPPKPLSKDKLPSDSTIFKAKAFETERKRLQEEQRNTNLKDFYIDKNSNKQESNKSMEEVSQVTEENLENYIEKLDEEVEVPQIFNENEKIHRPNKSLFKIKLKKKPRNIDELSETLNNQREERERLANEKAKRDEVEKQKMLEKEKERKERERIENERKERERIENERIENERKERERIENEKIEREQREREEREREEKAKLDLEQLKSSELEKIKEESIVESEDKNSMEQEHIFKSESNREENTEIKNIPIVQQVPETPIEIKEDIPESIKSEKESKVESEKEDLVESDPKTDLESGILFTTEPRNMNELNPDNSTLLHEDETKLNSLLMSKVSEDQGKTEPILESQEIEEGGDMIDEMINEKKEGEDEEEEIKEEILEELSKEELFKEEPKEEPPKEEPPKEELPKEEILDEPPKEEPPKEEPKVESEEEIKEEPEEKSEEEIKEEPEDEPKEESKEESKKDSESDSDSDSDSDISGVKDSELSNMLENAESLPRDENDDIDNEIEDFTKFNSLIGRNGEVIDLTRQNSKVDDEASLAKVNSINK